MVPLDVKPRPHGPDQRLVGPIKTARGLPNCFYSDRDHFEVEKDRVFAANWACIGFAKDVANRGDVKPLTFLGIPLLLARGHDGVVRVFQNVCRHRGMILIEEPRNIRGVIRCPYHSWCYGLDGGLKATPHVGGPGQGGHPAVDRKALGLFEVRAQVWMDLIFVNLSGTAKDFREAAGPLIARWKAFKDQPLYHGGTESSFRLEVATNWKLAVENYCESYHLPWIHPDLNSYSRLEDHYNIVEPHGFAGQGTRVYAPPLATDSAVAGQGFATFHALPAKWDSCAEYIALFPNALLGLHKDHFYGIYLEPVAHDKTIEHVEIYYAAAAMTGDDWAELRTRNARQWKGVFEEDVFVVEGMQRGRAAPRFDGGRFSPVMDNATHAFHCWVAEQVGRNSSAGQPSG